MRYVATLCLLVLVSLLAAAERLDPRVLISVKEATAYIKTTRGTGSGFLFKTVGSVGWLATNAHVVAEAVRVGGQVVVVFGSGTGKERPMPSLVVGFDEARDLAILRVEGEGLPKPLLLQGKAKVDETMSVWVVGFPFGNALAVGDANPAPTITPTQVSSVRTDTLGNIEAIQTSGGINPGNSGGPIVNSRGGVIGVSVAKVRGAEIGFGIPAATLEDTLAGRITTANPIATAGTGGSVDVSLTASFIDPLENITRISALVTPASRVTGELKSDAKGRITGPITTGMTETVMVYKDQVATGSVKVRIPKDTPQEVVVQFRYQRKDGTTHFTNDLRCVPGGAAPAAGAPAAARPPGTAAPSGGAIVAFTYTPPKITPVTPPADAVVSGRTERDASGRSFTALTAAGTPLDLGKDVLQIAVHPSGKEVYVIRKDDPAVMVLDPLTWKTIAEIPVPESPTSIWADSTLIGVTCGKSRVMALIDVPKRALVASGSSPELAKYTPIIMIGRAPDGSVMSVWQLDGGAWWDRALVHTTVDGTTRIMINGEPFSWATWLPNGSGVISQGDFSNSPSGTFDLAFPQGPKNFAELHNSKILGGVAPFHTDSGPAFLTADRKAIVWRRNRVNTDDQGQGPWTYLLSPNLDTVIRDFPGSAIVELPDQRLFITVGQNRGSGQDNKPICYYVSSTDGRVVRKITLEPPPNNHGYHASTPSRPHSGALFLPGHELLLVPSHTSRGHAGTPLTYTAYRCGPVINAVEPPANAGATNDPPPTAIVGNAVTYAPTIAAGTQAKDFRLRRPLPGMTIDAKTGVWNWRPGKEHVGRWTVTILATVDNEEATVITWTIAVQ